MFKITRRDKRTNLDKEIDSVLKRMSEADPSCKGYAAMADNLEKLYKAKGIAPKPKVSPDVIAVGVFGLIQIGMILWHEKADIITSKAVGFVTRGRV